MVETWSLMYLVCDFSTSFLIRNVFTIALAHFSKPYANMYFCSFLILDLIPLSKCKDGYQFPSVRKYRPQSDHVERSDLAKRFFIARWERERAKREPRERSRRGKGLNTSQWAQHDLVG
jgi:hypothetical protein